MTPGLARLKDLQRRTAALEASGFYVEEISAPEAAATDAIMAAADFDIAATGLELDTSDFTIYSFVVPRQIVFTTISSANWDTSTVIAVTGTDADGNVITDTVTVASNSTLTTTKFFKTLTGISVPAQTDAIANASQVGISTKLGLRKVARETDDGKVLVLAEYVGNVLVNGSNVVSDQFTRAGADPAAADADGFFDATVGVLVAGTLTVPAASFNGAIGSGVPDVPRNVTFTASGAITGSAVVTGLDVYGNVMTETIDLSGGAGAKTGAKLFAEITTVAATAAAAGETITMGSGAILGLSRVAKVAAGGSVPALIAEFEDGSAPTAGALSAPATNAPTGGYVPNSALGSNAFGAIYEAADRGVFAAPSETGEDFGSYTPAVAADALRNYTLVYGYVA